MLEGTCQLTLKWERMVRESAKRNSKVAGIDSDGENDRDNIEGSLLKHVV